MLAGYNAGRRKIVLVAEDRSSVIALIAAIFLVYSGPALHLYVTTTFVFANILLLEDGSRISLNILRNMVYAREADYGADACNFNFLGWVGIQWRADEIYACKFCAAVVDLLVNLDNFW